MKLGLAAGALGVGVTTLSLVGSGVTANFTAQVTDHQSVTSGTFHLRATDPVTYANDPSIGVTPGVSSVTGGNTNAVRFTQTNADPTATYKYQFTAYDSGSLSGEVNQLVYTPQGTPNALMQYARIEVEQCVHNSGACQTVRTTLKTTTGWQPISYAPTNSPNPPPPPPYPAVTAETLHFRYPGGDGLNGFVNPNSVQTGANNGNPATLKSEDSGWVTYRVIVTFTHNIPNAAEGEEFSFTLSATGHNI